MAAGDKSVMSTCDRSGARSHASTRCAMRMSCSARAARGFGGGLPRRTDAATGLRIVDAIVVHPAQHDQERLLHLLDLLQCERGLIQLAGVDLRAHDVIDRFLDLLWRQVLQL